MGIGSRNNCLDHYRGSPHIPAALREQLSNGHSFLDGFSWKGFGAATLIAVYDYAGYYNVCLIGGELKKPERTIPYSIIASILLVGGLYVMMNMAILGVLPIEQSMHSTVVIADYMQAAYNVTHARIADVLILIASFASVLAILLGYSRIPFAAAQDGEFLASSPSFIQPGSSRISRSSFWGFSLPQPACLA